MQNRNDLDTNKMESKKDRGDVKKRIKLTNSLPKKDFHATFIKDRGDLLSKNDKGKTNKNNEVSEDSKNVQAEDLNKQFKRFNCSDIKNKNDGGLNIPKLDLTTKIVKPKDGFSSKKFEKSNSFDTALKNTTLNEACRNNSKNPPNLDNITDKSAVKFVKHEVIPKNTGQNKVLNKSFANNVVKRNVMGGEKTISGNKEVYTKQKLPQRPVIRTIVAKNDPTKVFKAVVAFAEEKKTNMPLQIRIPVPMNQTDGDVNNLNNKRPGNKGDPTFLREENGPNNSRNMKDLNISQKNCVVQKIKKDPKISTDTKVSKRSRRDVINLARNRREPKVPQSNDTESKTSASGKNRVNKKESKRLKKLPSPMTLFTDSGSPITEVAKWTPNCGEQHTQRYYEAWVDTALRAVDRDPGANHSLARAVRRAVERAPLSPELTHENYLDERYTGRIKINHRQ